ncbi:MAG: Hsp70 family protein [Spirochaetia bacterium]
MNQNEHHVGPRSTAARTAHGIGIEVHGGRAVALIPAGSRTPVARAMTFTTVADGQRAVEVRVVRCSTDCLPQLSAGYRGADTARPAGVVGRFLVPGLRTGRRGEARIDIGISLDTEGVIRAWGVDRSTGARQEATFAGFWALAPEARPVALSGLARKVDAELARPEFEEAPALRKEGRLMKKLPGEVPDGPGLAALAGEIHSIRRSTAEHPVRF